MLNGRMFFALLFTFAAHAIEKPAVIFLSVTDPSGQKIDLDPAEPSGKAFFHVAISHRGGWLHSQTWAGVQKTRSMEPYGHVELILEPSRTEWNRIKTLYPSESEIDNLIGRKFDFFFNWATDQELYCSELVAKILKIKPIPMRFGGPYWQKYFEKRGQPMPHSKSKGMSPDSLYTALIKRGWRHKR